MSSCNIRENKLEQVESWQTEQAATRDVNGSDTDVTDIVFVFIFLFEYGVGYEVLVFAG